MKSWESQQKLAECENSYQLSLDLTALLRLSVCRSQLRKEDIMSRYPLLSKTRPSGYRSFLSQGQLLPSFGHYLSLSLAIFESSSEILAG